MENLITMNLMNDELTVHSMNTEYKLKQVVYVRTGINADEV